jgi:hypothetical protein
VTWPEPGTQRAGLSATRTSPSENQNSRPHDIVAEPLRQDADLDHHPPVLVVIGKLNAMAS